MAISLWLDTTSDPDMPAWVVSRDTPDTTTTVRTYAYDDYGSARAFAEQLAAREGRPMVESGGNIPSDADDWEPRDARGEMKTMTVTVYVVRDANGEYVRDTSGRRTPASDQAHQFDTTEEAQAACTRATDRVFTRDVHGE